jgi:hypothetical protein
MPKPTEFAEFAEYELAMIGWAQEVSELPEMPPNAEQVGEIIGLVGEGEVMQAPPPPPPEEMEPAEQISSVPARYAKLEERLTEMRCAYAKFLGRPTEVRVENEEGYSPKFMSLGLTVSEIRARMRAYGVPVAEGGNLTLVRLSERSIADFGRITAPSIFAPGESIANVEKIKECAGDRALQLVLKNFSVPDFDDLLKISLGTSTIGNAIAHSLGLERLIALSGVAFDGRFRLKLSLLMQQFLLIPSLQGQLMHLSIPQLEHFVELVTYPKAVIFPFAPFPDEELEAAYGDDPAWISEIDVLVTSVRQSRALATLCRFVVSCPQVFLGCLDFVRGLLHRAIQHLTPIVGSKTRFGRVLDGFFSSKPLVHQFYSRILRSVIALEMGAVSRALAFHDLFHFFEHGLASPHPFVSRQARSVLQLVLHTSTCQLFRFRIDTAPASEFVETVNRASPEYFRSISACFCLFLRLDFTTDFGVLRFQQFRALFGVLAADHSNERCLTFLCYLLQLCRRCESIFCLDRDAVRLAVNEFAKVRAAELLKNATATKMRCLKLLFKIPLLDADAIQNPDLWSGILSEMRSRQDVPGLREQAWKTFRNAFLYQPLVGPFLLMNTPDLAKKVGDCFSSLDERVSTCMVKILPSLSRPLILGEGPGLWVLWEKLAEPSVLIAGKIRLHYKSSMRGGSGAVRTALVEFVHVMLDAMSMERRGGESLVGFITSPHIWAELSEMVRDVAELFNRKGMLFG